MGRWCLPQSNYMGGWFRSISNSMGGGLMSLYAEGENITCQKKEVLFRSGRGHPFVFIYVYLVIFSDFQCDFQ